MTTDFCHERLADRRLLRATPGQNGTPMRRLSDLDDEAFERFIQQLLAEAARQPCLELAAWPAMA
ncbi:hypothetical protein [Aquabacterium sp.]|uniref:hypothetical protein n=1 Tax=Aquabacterium sp. TaxID=1872578 RepID=UPI002C4A9136|nr:hypothetical protein [Aquabacterium sp.]HSW08187.1 hypothetical protein [Aquabacterium sp.]